MSNPEKPTKEEQNTPKFEVHSLPRLKEGDVSPAGITYTRKRSFRELPQAIREEVASGHISFEDAWRAHFGDMEGAYSVPFGDTVKQKITELTSAIENRDENSKEIFASLTNDERTDFRNAISLHVSAGRSTEGEESVDQPAISNIAESLRVVMKFNRSFLSGTYNLKQLNSEAKRLIEEEHKKQLASKYAKDLTLFFEADTADPDKVDFETQTIGNQSLQRALEELFAQNSSSSWHRAFMASREISEDAKTRILSKIKECQDNADAGQDKKDPRHTGELTDSFLSVINPDKEAERVGASPSFEGKQYNLFQLFTKKQLRAESDALGHCVGNTDTYFHAIREGRRRIFSVRHPNGTSEYTIAYDQKEGSITQFRGKNNLSINPSQEKSALLLWVLNTLEQAGFKVSAIREDLNYSVVKVNGVITRGGKFSVNDTLAFLRSSGENRVIRSELLKIKDDLSERDLLLLSQAEGLTLNLTEVQNEAKKKIVVVKGDLVDHSRAVDYGNLHFIGGNANFVNLEDASGLRNLTEIGGVRKFSEP